MSPPWFLVLIGLGVPWSADYLVVQSAPVCADGCKCSETIWNCRKSGLWIWPTDTVTSPAPHVLSLDVSFNPALLVLPDHPLIEKFPGLKLVDIRGTGLPCHSRYCLELGGVTVFSDCPAGAMKKCSQPPCCFVQTGKIDLEARGMTSTVKDLFRPIMAPVSPMKLPSFTPARPNVSQSTERSFGVSSGISGTGRFVDESTNSVSESAVFAGRTEDYLRSRWKVFSSTDKRVENLEVSSPSVKMNRDEALSTVTSTDSSGSPTLLLGSLRKDSLPLFTASPTSDVSLSMAGETKTLQLSEVDLGSSASVGETEVSMTLADVVIDAPVVATLDRTSSLSEFLIPSNVLDWGVEFGVSSTGSPVLGVVQSVLSQPGGPPEYLERLQAKTPTSSAAPAVVKKDRLSTALSDILTTDSMLPLLSGSSAASFPLLTTPISFDPAGFIISDNITLESGVYSTGDNDRTITQMPAATLDSKINAFTDKVSVISLESPDLALSSHAPVMVSRTLLTNALPPENRNSQPLVPEPLEEVFTPTVGQSIPTTTTAPGCRPCQPCTPCAVPEVTQTLALTQLSERDYKIGTITMTITTGAFLLATLIWKFWWTRGGRNERSDARILNETGFSETTNIFQTPRREPLGPRAASTPKEPEGPMSVGNPFLDGNRDLVLEVAASSTVPAVLRDQSESRGSSENNSQPSTFETAIKAPGQSKKSEVPKPTEEEDRRTLRNTVRKNYKE